MLYTRRPDDLYLFRPNTLEERETLEGLALRLPGLQAAFLGGTLAVQGSKAAHRILAALRRSGLKPIFKNERRKQLK